MELTDLLEELNAGCTITGDSPLHEVMHRTSQEALRVTGELNGGYQEPAPIVIGNNVWIGSNTTVLPGVRIGDDAVVAAASVVSKDVPDGAVVVGSPARVVRSVTG